MPAPSALLPVRRVCRALRETLLTVLLEHLGLIRYPNHLEHFGREVGVKILQEIANIAQCTGMDVAIYELHSSPRQALRASFGLPLAGAAESASAPAQGLSSMTSVNEDSSSTQMRDLVDVIFFKNGHYCIRTQNQTLQVHRLRAVAGETCVDTQVLPGQILAVIVNDSGTRVAVCFANPPKSSTDGSEASKIDKAPRKEEGAEEEEEEEEDPLGLEDSDLEWDEGSQVRVFRFDGTKLAQQCGFELATAIDLSDDYFAFIPPLAGPKLQNERIAVLSLGWAETWDIETGEQLYDEIVETQYNSVLPNGWFAGPTGVNRIDLSGSRPEVVAYPTLPAESFAANPISNITWTHNNLLQVDRLTSIAFLRGDNGQVVIEIPVKPTMSDVYFFPQIQKCLHNDVKMYVTNSQHQTVFSTQRFSSPTSVEAIGEHVACIVEGDKRIYFFNLKTNEIYETMLPGLIERRRQHTDFWRLKANPHNPYSVVLLTGDHLFVIELSRQTYS